MTQAEYDAWVDRYGIQFGFQFESDLKMLNSWFDVLRGHDARDLSEAAGRLLRRAVPVKQLRDYLHLLQAELRQIEAVSLQHRREQEDPRGECALCGGSGRVTVPHPAGVVNGEWRPVQAGAVPCYYELSVFCRCPRGRWRAGRTEAPEGKHALTLEAYERRVPNWQKIKRARKEALAAEGRLSGETWGADIARKLVERLRTREPGEDDEILNWSDE